MSETQELEGGFSRRTVGWIVGSAVASFVIAALLSVYGRDLENRPTPRANTFSYSALGHRGLSEFLRKMGLGVYSRQAPVGGGLGPGRPLVVAEPDLANLGRVTAVVTEALARRAPLVLVLPKWKPGSPEKKRPDWLSAVTLRPSKEVQRVIGALGPDAPDAKVERRRGGLRCTAQWGDAETEFQIDTGPAQLLPPSPDLDPVITCSGGYLIARRSGRGATPIYLIADPDLINNQGLDRGGNAEGIYQFFVRDLGATGVVFDETVHGFDRVPGLLAAALRFPMLLGTLQSLLLFGVVLWAGMGRFGKPLPPPAPLAAGKEVLIDNTAKLLAGGGHAGDSLLDYFRQTTRTVAAHHFLPADLPEAERLARLQRITDAHQLGLNLAALERSIPRISPGRRGEEQAVRIARRLHAWRWEMMNGNRQGS